MARLVLTTRTPASARSGEAWVVNHSSRVLKAFAQIVVCVCLTVAFIRHFSRAVICKEEVHARTHARTQEREV